MFCMSGEMCYCLPGGLQRKDKGRVSRGEPTNMIQNSFYQLDPHQTLGIISCQLWCFWLKRDAITSEMFDHGSCQVLELLFDEVFKDSCIWSWFASGARIIEGGGLVSQSMGLTDTCLQFVPLWNFLAGLFLIKLSAWFPVMSIQLSR